MSASRAQVYRRRRLVVFGGAAVFLAAATYLPMTLFAPLDPTAATLVDAPAPTAAAAELAWPSSTAVGIGAVGFDGVLAATGSTEALPMASITKVITALTVLERHPITVDDHGPVITFTSKDLAHFGSYQARGATVKPVQAGMQLTQYEAMQAMLLPSAANYTLSLVEWAFGDEATFVAAAQDWIASHGLDNTTLVEPTGLSPQNRSTVSDLIRLGKIALEDPVIAEIVATPQVYFDGAGVLENSNKILGTYGVDGIKTGTLPEAGACLLFSADLEIGSSTVTLVGVALGGELHAIQYPQIQSLIQTVEAGFQEIALTEEGQSFGGYSTVWGDNAPVVAGEAKKALVWADTPISVAVHTEPVVTAAAGTQVGTATYTVGQDVLEVPLVLAEAIDDPGPAWRLGNPSLVFG
ncbi:D-alanyl-D-alanine carboxypeptidase family protein [Salinibacterium sp. GXW1014]|uniref:D-alanyl-D-alanine carboxypeptidase family protein n=1 Tax=Salinibacterium sp. GXW1014 TaxID=3377838 RepID=UPI00383A9125